MQLIVNRFDVQIYNSYMELPQNQEEIIAEVKTYGYCCTTKYDKPISGLEVLQLPLYVDLSTTGFEDIDNFHVIGLSDDQQPWVKCLKFNYRPTDDDYWDEIYDLDVNGPLTCRGKLMVNVYYKEIACPSEGSRFDSIDDDGQIDHWRVEGDSLYCNDQFFAPISKWSEYNIFVVRQY